MDIEAAFEAPSPVPSFLKLRMRDHKHLLAWQRARELVIRVQRLTDRIWRHSYAAMIWQLQRSCLSVQLNVAEGYALGTTRQFARHAAIAYGSAVEATEILELLEELSDQERNALRALIILSRRNCALVLALKHGLDRKIKRDAQPESGNDRA